MIIYDLDLHLVKIGDKYGYVSANTGRMEIKAKFDWAGSFSEGLASVKVGGFNGKYGYIDPSGEWAINPKYDHAKIFKCGLAPVLDKNTGWVYINTLGEVAIAIEALHARVFSEGLAAVNFRNILRGARYGYIDINGKSVTDLIYNDAFNFHEGVARVKIDGSYTFINKYLNRNYNLYKDAKDFSEGYASVDNGNSCWGFIDISGKLVIGHKYGMTNSFTDGLCAVTEDTWALGKFGFINKSGTLTINYTYPDILQFSEGLAVIRNKRFWGKYGFIDKQGNQIIEPKFNKAFSFKGGIAPVKNDNNKWGYINKNGELVINYEYDEAGSKINIEGSEFDWEIFEE